MFDNKDYQTYCVFNQFWFMIRSVPQAPGRQHQLQVCRAGRLPGFLFGETSMPSLALRWSSSALRARLSKSVAFSKTEALRGHIQTNGFATGAQLAQLVDRQAIDMDYLMAIHLERDTK